MAEDIESITIEYQKIQSRIRALSLQKVQLNVEKEEYKKALEEIDKSEGKIYVSRGNVIVEVSKEESIKSIKNEQDEINLKFSIVEKQYAEAVKKEQELRNKINDMIKKK